MMFDVIVVVNVRLSTFLKEEQLQLIRHQNNTKYKSTSEKK
jgi:hypothetical protein